jgi:uncharacterized membrane protein HdeD (DUF308 family)
MWHEPLQYRRIEAVPRYEPLLGLYSKIHDELGCFRNLLRTNAARRSNMTAASVEGFAVQASPEIVQHWGWFLVFGIGLLALGIAAVMRSVTATIVSMVFFGWLLVLASGIEVAQAVMVGNWAGFFLHLLAAILFGVAGLLIVVRPAVSAEVITMFMAMFFLIGGLFQLIGSMIVAYPGWGWQAADGLITFLLGLLLIAGWPATGLWVIGLFIGINLIVYGIAWIALALGLRGS